MTTINPLKVAVGKLFWERTIIPAMKQAPGFRHLYVLGDDKTNTVMTISLWESEAAADAWEKSESQKSLRSGLLEHVSHMPAPQVYQVKLEA
jgi:heme-degrading monooxygenase HmoA